MISLRMLVIVACLLPLAPALGADKPNVLFIMSDDHCAEAVGAYQGRLAALNPTPTIDRLAREGVLFENCFVTNSICTPSRASILTGQYSHVNGVYDLRGRLNADRQYLAHEMKKAGYHTAMIGKWHLREEPAAFDHYKVLPNQGAYFDPDFRVRGEKPWPQNVVSHPGEHSSDAITDSSLKWLQGNWNRDKPFFLMHHFKAPHDMFSHAPRYKDYLADEEIPEPESLWKQPKFGSIATRGHEDELLPYLGTSIGRRHWRRNYVKQFRIPSALSDEQAKRKAYNIYLKRYLRCVKGIDDNLARLFACLKEMGQFDNTLIVYTGDQGFMLGEHDYMDKRWMYEPSQQMPLLIRYPAGIKAGQRTNAIVENVDFAATLLDFAGAETPDSMQGRSFRSICESGKEPQDWKQAAYYRYWMHMAHHANPSHLGIRTKDFKLIYFYGCDKNGHNQTPPGWELYDLRDDPHEMVNRYDDPEYRATVVQLKEQLRLLRKKIGDTDESFPKMKATVERFWDYDEEDRAEAIAISKRYLEQRRPQSRNEPSKTVPSTR